MKLFYVLVILIIFQSCSFDNKTGIWKNENSISNKDNDLFNEFKKFLFLKIILMRKLL